MRTLREIQERLDGIRTELANPGGNRYPRKPPPPSVRRRMIARLEGRRDELEWMLGEGTHAPDHR